MSRLWERPVVAPVYLVRWSRIMALFVLCPGAIECLARCDGFVASDRIDDSAQLGSALVRLIHYMLSDCHATWSGAAYLRWRCRIAKLG